MKALIINYNRLTLPAAMADWLAENGCEPIFIDNCSTYEPLLEYYHHCPYMVMHLNRNYGHKVVWTPEATILQRLGITDRYIVTDPDLDLSAVPSDFLEVLHEGLNRYPEYKKCGLSLEINDLPDNPEIRAMRDNCEARYWTEPLDDRYFKAAIDTTLALHRADARHYFHRPALRTNRPYTARHVPWYYEGLADLPEDEKFYFQTAGNSSTNKDRIR